MSRCNHGDGVTVSIGGILVDPCIMDDIKEYRNVTVVVSKCRFCGKITWSWKRQENTEEIENECI